MQTSKNSEQKIKVGVSSCLMGQKVRFDTGHKKHHFTSEILSEYFDYTPFCPEVAIGLPVPRQPIRLIQESERIECVGTKDASLNVTEQLIEIAHQQSSWHADLAGYIVKKDSPSCGMSRVKLYKGNHPTKEATGLYTQTLMNNFPNLPVEEEGRLCDPILREHFIKRVFMYQRWKTMTEQNFDYKELLDFHARHKYMYMSHSPLAAKELGNWLAHAHTLEISIAATEYINRATKLLSKQATRKTHTNTLAHLQGYLKKHISKQDKAELVNVIGQYKQGYLPLIAPMMLLRHHFMHFPNTYVRESHYLNPHPEKLMLLNSI
jgi:uncharacterized protein YbgA (DUF1722 family)/uncharacterized protein YbbK (DUF523 family)